MVLLNLVKEKFLDFFFKGGGWERFGSKKILVGNLFGVKKWSEFFRKSFWVKKNLGQKFLGIFLGSKKDLVRIFFGRNFFVNIFFGQHYFLQKKNSNFFGRKKNLGQHFFGSTFFWVKFCCKNFLDEKNLGQKKIWVKKNLGQKNLGQKKNFTEKKCRSFFFA